MASATTYWRSERLILPWNELLSWYGLNEEIKDDRLSGKLDNEIENEVSDKCEGDSIATEWAVNTRDGAMEGDRLNERWMNWTTKREREGVIEQAEVIDGISDWANNGDGLSGAWERDAVSNAE